MSHVQTQCTVTILVYSTEFVVKVSVPPYEARYAGVCCKKRQEWTTEEVVKHCWQGRSKAKSWPKLDSRQSEKAKVDR